MRKAKRLKYRATYRRLLARWLAADEWEEILIRRQIEEDCFMYYYNDPARWQTEQMYSGRNCLLT